jgi:predicted dehydrogenase
MAAGDGMNYAPRAKAEAVVQKGEFSFGVVGLDHGHIYGMAHGLEDAGATIMAVYDPDPAKVDAFLKEFPDAERAPSEAAVLDRDDIALVASAAVTADRGPLGLRVMDHGKHYFSDKAPFTTFEQLEAAKAKVRETGLLWSVCYSERVQNESAIFAGQLIQDGAIGTVLQVIGMGPHRLGAANRPDWFFRKERYGGILTDIGSHQVEQFLYFAGAKDAKLVSAQVANYNHPDYPELEDFGDASFVADNGATNYFRVDWFTPDGLSTWGDGRTFILGTEGFIELRKYTDIARKAEGNQVYLANGEGEQHLSVDGQVGFPYFGELILDCLNGTQNAMPQEHTFKAAELCLTAQRDAVRIATTPVK